MKRWIVLMAGLLLAFAVQASDSVRFGSRVITVGDSESKVLDVAGEPERRVQLQNRYGAATGCRLDYEVGRKTVQIFISQGRVVAIDEVY